MGEKMKKILLSAALFVAFAGVATGSSINGEYNGNPIVKVNSNGQSLSVEDTPAIIYQDRTMVPIYLLKQLGATVTWDQSTYSVNVTLPNSNTDTLKKYAITADYCIYLEHAVQFVFNFSSAMDLYAKGTFSENQINEEYNKNGEKLNEAYQKAVAAYGKVADGMIWGNINSLLTETYAINDGIKDAYIDLVAYRMSLDQSDKALADSFYSSYISKMKATADRSTKLIDKIRSEYAINIGKAMQ